MPYYMLKHLYQYQLLCHATLSHHSPSCHTCTNYIYCNTICTSTIAYYAKHAQHTVCVTYMYAQHGQRSLTEITLNFRLLFGLVKVGLLKLAPNMATLIQGTVYHYLIVIAPCNTVEYSMTCVITKPYHTIPPTGYHDTCTVCTTIQNSSTVIPIKCTFHYFCEVVHCGTGHSKCHCKRKRNVSDFVSQQVSLV